MEFETTPELPMFGFLKPSAAPRTDLAEALGHVAQGKALLLDVREGDELRRSGRAKGAHHLALSDLARTSNPASGHFDKRLAAARKAGHPLYLYCASGARSGRAADILRKNGFSEIHNLGGLNNVLAAGAQLQR